MNIGVWIGSAVNPQMGGGYSYIAKLIHEIDNHSFPNDICIKFLSRYDGWRLNNEVIVLSLLPACVRRWMLKLDCCGLLSRVEWKLQRIIGIKKLLKKKDIKLIYYLTQGECLFPDFPFVATNWDIGHCSTYAFPELVYNNNFYFRNKFYTEVLPKALLVLCESETGKQELLDYTTVGKHKIRIVPMFAGNVSTLKISESTSYLTLCNLGIEKEKYFFYPAQFWAHKNHYNLLQAFHSFRQIHEGYKLVLCGSDKGNLSYVKDCCEKLNLVEDVIFLGFVSEEVLYTLYKYCVSFIMASHFGPTNMPPIEAMEIGCPVICSDLGGHREIMGDSAIYFDSFSPDSILQVLEEIISRRDYYLGKVQNQRSVTKFNVLHAINALEQCLLEAVEIRSNWN